jgi:23S rRNA (uracil1939-C5)-methyltransferase
MARGQGKRLEVTVDALGARGDGIAQSGGERLYIGGALPGERCLVQPGNKRGDGRAARLIERLESSHVRREPPCPHAARCGGCVLQHADPELYAAWKRSNLIDTLARRGFDAEIVAPMESAPPGSRRRLRFALARRDQHYMPAFRAAQSHDLVAIETCVVADPPLLDAAKQLAAALGPHRVREIELTATKTGIDATAMADGDPPLALAERLGAIAEEAGLARLAWKTPDLPAYVVAQANNPSLTFGAVTLPLPPGAFVQPTAWGEARIVSRVEPLLAGCVEVADLYAGCGALGFALAAGRKLAMFEAVEAMTTAARTAARLHGLNITASARDLDHQPLTGAELERFDGVLLDPPRTGARATCEALAVSRVANIAYVSCHPGSFARDARILADGGYVLERIWPIDQFLWSHHLELIAHFVAR